MELRLPHVGFNRARRRVRRPPRHARTGALIDDASGPRGVDDWLPTDADRAPRRVADAPACTSRAGWPAWIAPPASGHPRQAGRLRLRAGLSGERHGARTTPRPGCSTATSTAGDGDVAVAYCADERRPTRTCSARCGGPSTPCATLDVRPRRAGRAGRRTTSRPSSPGSSGALRSGVVPVPLSTMLTAGELAAIVGRRGRRRAWWCRSVTPATSPPSRAAGTELRHAVGDRRRRRPATRTCPTHAWASFDDDSEAPVAATTADSPAFWLYSSGTTGAAEGRHAPPRQPARRPPTTYARVGARRSRPTTAACRSPSCSSPTASATR